MSGRDPAPRLQRPRAIRRSSPLVAAPLVVMLIGGVLAGCQSASTTTPAFNNEGGRDISCMAHQTHQPTVDYTGGEKARSQLVLGMLAYYTANGRKGYCDRKPATAFDRTWASLYLQLTGAMANVAPDLPTK